MMRATLGSLILLAATTACAGHHEKHDGHDHQADGSHAAPADEQAMMMAMQAAATPGAEHAKLRESIGEYSADMQFWTGPDSPPMTSIMSVKRTMDLGGRVLVEHWKGDVMGAPFEGVARTGFDNVTKRYWSTWSDNMSTGLLLMYGTWDDAKEAMVLAGESTHPVTGETYSTRSIGTYPSSDREELVMYEDHGAGEYKSMAFTLTRQ